MPNQLRSWEENYEALMEYRRIHGNCMVPLRFTADKILGKWVSTQRESRYVLKPERKELLDKIGFEWHPRQRRSDEKWTTMFERLVEYIEDGTELSTVFTAQTADPELVKWCCNQREYSGRGLLNEERYKRLEKLGFPVRPLQKSVQARRESEQIIAAPTAGADPFRSKMSSEKIKVKSIPTDSMKVPSNPFHSSATTVTSKVQARAMDVMGTSSSNPSHSHAAKVKSKVQAKAMEIMETSTIKKIPIIFRLQTKTVQERPKVELEKIHKSKQDVSGDEQGHIDDSMTSSSSSSKDPSPTRRRSWLESYAVLAEFKRQHGHCRVPIQYKEDKQLGIWVGEQKKRKYLMSEERREKLEELGFTWANPRGKQWSAMFQKLQEYRREHPDDHRPKNFNLRKWLEAQRHAVSDGSLSLDCIRKLQSIGFDWSDQIVASRKRRTSQSSCETHGNDVVAVEDEPDDTSAVAVVSPTKKCSVLPPKKRRVSAQSEPDGCHATIVTPQGSFTIPSRRNSNSNSGANMGAAESLLSLASTTDDVVDKAQDRPARKRKKPHSSCHRLEWTPRSSPSSLSERNGHIPTKGSAFESRSTNTATSTQTEATAEHYNSLWVPNHHDFQQAVLQKPAPPFYSDHVNHSRMSTHEEGPWQQQWGPWAQYSAPTKAELNDVKAAEDYLTLVRQFGLHRR